MPMVSTPVTMSTAPKPAPIASWDMPCDQLSEERSMLGPGLLMGLHSMQTSLRTGQLQHAWDEVGQAWKTLVCVGEHLPWGKMLVSSHVHCV